MHENNRIPHPPNIAIEARVVYYFTLHWGKKSASEHIRHHFNNCLKILKAAMSLLGPMWKYTWKNILGTNILGTAIKSKTQVFSEPEKKDKVFENTTIQNIWRPFLYLISG